jgi:TonB-linked SusC/RagA family outer membrane protein
MKLKLRILLSTAFVLCLLVGAYAQNIQFKGKVNNKATGENLVGASIIVKGTKQSTISDQNGRFTISIPANGAVLVISYVGMTSIESQVSASSKGEFLLETSNALNLDEVVVVGYGSQKITKVSGAISTIKSIDIEKINAVRTEEALQGRAAGVNVIQGGSPGSKPTVLIRGIPSFTGTDPTVIVDGVQQSLTDLNSINPADIETINVLKDAATTAIYGVKGGNGVIVVTTKSGRRNQKTEFSFSSNYGIQQVANTIGTLNASEYGAMINEGSTTAGGPIIFPNLSTLGVGTNWQKQIFKDAAVQIYSLNAKGGSDKMTYLLSAGYLNQGGTVGGNDKSNFTRGNFTANLNFDLSSKLKLIVNASALTLDSKGVPENSFNSVLGSALNFDPTVAIYNTTNTGSKYGFSNLLLSEIFNPLTVLENTYNKNVGTKLYGKFELQYNVAKNLNFISRFGYTKYDGNAKSFSPLAYYGPLNVENSMNADGSAVVGKHNRVAHEKTSNFNYTFENYFNYTLKRDAHSFDLIGGIAASKLTGNAAGATRQDVPFNSWEFADFTAATGTNISTNTDAVSGYYYQYFRKNISYFGRLNYDYSEKYLASVSARRDGSIAFGKENQFGNFYAGSLGWVVSNEKFFKSNFVNFFKIRGSYGTTGNENVNPQFVGIITGGPSYGPTANSNGYSFGESFTPGSTIGSAANNALRWEKQIQTNIGFDLNFADNHFSINADYFSKTVDGLLFTPSASLYLGTVPIPQANIGTTTSKGFDFTLNYRNNPGKKVKVNSSLTFTTAINEVTSTNSDGTAKIFGGSYFNGQSQVVTVFEKGFTPGYFYGYKTDGLFQNAAAVAAAPKQAGAQAGDIKFVDINGDNVIDALDKTKIGDPFAKFTLGWNMNVQVGNFDFVSFVYASVGNDVYRAFERNANYTNKPREILARWTGENSTNDARFPRYSFIDNNNNARVSDRYVEDGSFIKIKNLQLGYSLPASLTKKGLNKVRFYVQVKNAYTFTKYTGYDPEIPGGILETGVDRGAYPQPRTFAVGLDIKF